MYTPQESIQIQLWRQKINNGTITKDELKEALFLLSRSRTAGATASAASKTRKAASKAPINSDSLLDELGGL